jgi:hypothetical protein
MAAVGGSAGVKVGSAGVKVGSAGVKVGSAGVKVGCGYPGLPPCGGLLPLPGPAARRQPGGASGAPGGPGRGARGGLAGGAGGADQLSAIGSVVSAAVGPPPSTGPASGGSGSGAACRPRRGESGPS